MDTSLLIQGIELMLLGMGIVFSFLIVLVVALRGMSWLASRMAGAELLEPAMPAPIDISDNRRLVAVISAAVARYRATRTG